MSVRVRVCYEKRGFACFVPHVALASIFTRAALRAGLSLTQTLGCSPHPKMSFAPELPAGVVALGELVDVYLDEVPEGLLARWNAAMPVDFRLLSFELPEEGAPSLGKVCQSARYWVRCVGSLASEELLARARAFYGDALLRGASGVDVEEDGSADWVDFVLARPAQNGIGGWVRRMVADGALEGWQDLNVVRAAIGPLATVLGVDCGPAEGETLRSGTTEERLSGPERLP